ncbi:NRDE-2, necessary for RNA interference-domain-containing protein [Coniochaeta sp. 2T2.1]|nr:NRDE-2, necessary for RNA interference-domain-containing protein [Coniochaeta sp. 2T2.1]
MSSKEKPRTVPKFGSFKPKEPPKTEPEERSKIEGGRTSVDSDFKEVKRHKSRYKDDDDRHGHYSRHESRSERHSERRTERHPDRERLIRRHTERQTERQFDSDPWRHQSKGPKVSEPVREVKSATDELFTFDKRGDPLILRYRSNERSRVPAYRRIRRRIILGSPGYLEIHDDGPRELFSIRTSNEGRSAFRDKSLLALAGKTKSRLYRNSTQQAPPAADQDFIALEPAKKRKREGDEDAESSSDRERKSYRSIEGKAKPQEDSDSAFESDSDDPDVERYYTTPAKRRSIELTRTVKERPADIEAWLDLIGLQDVLFAENEENDHVRTRDEVKALADIKVTMFEKALPHATLTEDREKLLIGLMREGSRVWRSQALAKRWADVTEKNPDSFALWKSRMDFELTNISTFSFDGIKQRFVDRLRFIESKLTQKTDDEDAQRHLAEEAIYVFLRLTCFLHETGFLDIAVGAWQAMLELVFARAILPEDSREAAMASLGEFWDNEVPRIGEPGATGWRKFVDDGSIGDLPEAKHQESKALPQTRDLYQAWAKAEVQHAVEARTPAKTVDEGTEDDPFRVIMFADIEPFLVLFPATLLHNIRQPLMDAYLMFCHLPPALVSDSGVLHSAMDDAFVFGGSRDFEKTLSRPIEVVDAASERKRQPPNFAQDGSRLAISPDVLIPGHSWFSYLACWSKLYPDHDEPIERSYVLTTLRQLVRTFGFEDIAEYYLGLEWVNDPPGAKKVAKAVLKQYPSNIELYNAYALIERANGNTEISLKVLQSAAGMASGAASQMLKNTRAWIELEATRLTQALAHLCFPGQVEAVATPALILKARSELSAQRDSLLSAGKPDQAMHYAIGLSLLSYLSPVDSDTGGREPQSADQGNITAAMAACSAFSAELTSRGLQHSACHERFLQFATRLVYYHATHGPFRPIYIRSQLHQYVTLFPKNTIFLSIFAWAESSLRIDDPVKALLQTTTLTPPHDTVSSRIFTIRYELQVGNAHSVRAAFGGALEESEACRGNSWLWLYYIRFCASRKAELRGKKAKDVFYRAVAACPGSKRLYMEAFTTLRGQMEESDLEAVLSTTTSKGLRVHVDFEGFARGWKG